MKKSPKEQRLEALEDEFRELLFVCLEACSKGRWGLFGQNTYPQSSEILRWPEADRLKVMAAEIQALRGEFGDSNALRARLIEYSQLRGQNVPGEPGLARKFLEEFPSDRSSSAG